VSLILASQSAIRRQMLGHAGVECQTVRPDVDEDAVKADGGEPDSLALRLAEAKALAVSRERPGDWVIGGDSIVRVGGRLFAKPRSRDEAAEHLRFFSGKAMELVSGVALARGGAIDWSHADQAELRVRALSEPFIQAYLDKEWEQVRWCVGVFRLEGPGVQLFDSVEGDHFTIMGLPLLPLLGALRQRGILPS